MNRIRWFSLLLSLIAAIAAFLILMNVAYSEAFKNPLVSGRVLNVAAQALVPPPDEKSPDADYMLTTASTPICSASQTQRLNRIFNEQMGVFGWDPVGSRVGSYPAERYLNINTWYPIDGYKRTLCGEVDHFNFYDGYGDEADWNFFMIPSSPFRYLIEDPKDRYLGSEWHDCRTTADCLEAEVTPDQSYYENFFNSKTNSNSIRDGRLLCTYGPWIRDSSHDSRPEIHPSELFWWRAFFEEPPSNPYWILMVLQDDSNRFDRSGDYDFGYVWEDPPDWWRAWSANPRTAEFRLTFSLNLQDLAPNYDITAIDSRNVVTKNDPTASLDSDDGIQHAINYNGRVVMTVRELQGIDEDLGVQFYDVCRNAADNRLSGYLKITTKVGVDDRGGEGLHSLRVTRDAIGILPPPPGPRMWFTGRAEEDSMYLDFFNGRWTWRGDITAARHWRSDVLPEDWIIESINYVQGDTRIPLEYDLVGDDVNPDFRIKDIPIRQSAYIEFVLGSGLVPTLPIPGFSLDSLLDGVFVEASNPDPNTMDSFLDLAGARNPGQGLEARLVHVDEYQMSAVPQYSNYRDGVLMSEDDSPFTERINEVIQHGTDAELRTLFNTTQPFSVTWSFQAQNLITGQAVPVVINAPVPEPMAVQVELQPSLVPTSTVQIDMPSVPEGEILALTATSVWTDTLGNSSQTQEVVYTHVLSGSQQSLVEAILPQLPALAGISHQEFLSDANLTDLPLESDEWTGEDPSARRARMIHLGLIDAAHDGFITPAELRSILEGADIYDAYRLSLPLVRR